MTSTDALPQVGRDQASRPAPSRRGEAGFTLLEVMCAFAILASLTGFLTVVYFNAVERGTRALHLRELREAADTLFRKIIYEEHRYSDGDSRTLDNSYAEFAGLRGYERDRWRVYKYVLRKERRTAAGSPDRSKGEESIFGDDWGEDEGGGGEGDSAEESVAGQALWRITLSLFPTESAEEEPLLVLRTYVPVRDEPGSGTGSAGG